MSQVKDSIFIKDTHIPVYGKNSSIVNKLQDLIDELTVLAGLFGYKTHTIYDSNLTFNSVSFSNDENRIQIFFQHTVNIHKERNTSVYAVFNSDNVDIKKIKSLF